MHGSSRAAAGAGQRVFDDVLAAGVDPGRLSQDLFGAAGAIDASAALRRALTDPTREGSAKSALAERVLGGKVDQRSAQLVGTLAAHRWSAERDLIDTLEDLAVQALVAGADSRGSADQVEDELFRFERIVAGTSGLREAITDRHADSAARSALVERLLAGKAQPETVRLATQAVTSPRGRRFDRVIEGQLATIARRRERLAATVTSALELDAAQRDRLAAALSSLYERQVSLHAVVDPRVIGGLRVQIGDEVLDGTVLRKLEGARRHMAT
ncbi:MAG: F0F1 ATP synthase subunit delta [Dermatophilaceae bacterium]